MGGVPHQRLYQRGAGEMPPEGTSAVDADRQEPGRTLPPRRPAMRLSAESSRSRSDSNTGHAEGSSSSSVADPSAEGRVGPGVRGARAAADRVGRPNSRLRLDASPASPMFNFSANHLFLLSRTEYRSCAVFLMQDRDTQRVYRLYDFTKALLCSSRLLP